MARLKTKAGIEFQIDEIDIIRASAFSWVLHGATGYLVSRIIGENKNQYLHRFITGVEKGKYVDHINHDKLDNRSANLRICTNSQNMQNSTKKKTSRSPYKGIWYNKRVRFWYAAIKLDGRTYNLGNFKCPIEAARAYDKKALALFGEYAKLNFEE